MHGPEWAGPFNDGAIACRGRRTYTALSGQLRKQLGAGHRGGVGPCSWCSSGDGVP